VMAQAQRLSSARNGVCSVQRLSAAPRVQQVSLPQRDPGVPRLRIETLPRSSDSHARGCPRIPALPLAAEQVAGLRQLTEAPLQQALGTVRSGVCGSRTAAQAVMSVLAVRVRTAVAWSEAARGVPPGLAIRDKR